MDVSFDAFLRFFDRLVTQITDVLTWVHVYKAYVVTHRIQISCHMKRNAMFKLTCRNMFGTYFGRFR